MKFLEEFCTMIFMSVVTVIIVFILFCEFGCAHKPIDTSLDINWEADEQGPGLPDRQCLVQKDVEKLIEVIDRCRAK